MRTLVFRVDGQKLYANSPSDIGGLVAGTSGYIKVKFIFSEAWNGCAKVVAFNSVYGEEFEPRPLDNDNSCYVPDAALACHEFEMKVLGKSQAYTIITRPVRIKQFGGKR